MSMAYCSILTKAGRDSLYDLLLLETLVDLKSEEEFKRNVLDIYDIYLLGSKDMGESFQDFNKAFFDILQESLKTFLYDYNWAYSYVGGDAQLLKLEATFNREISQNVNETDRDLKGDKTETNKEVKRDSSFLYSVYGTNSRARADIERRFSIALGSSVFFDPETDEEITTLEGFNKAILYKLNEIYLNLFKNHNDNDLPIGDLFVNLEEISPKLDQLYDRMLAEYDKDTINSLFDNNDSESKRKIEEFLNLFLLKNFDNLIKLKYPGVVEITTLKTGLNFNEKNKYRLLLGNSNLETNWSNDEELSSAVKEASGLIKLLFDSIPYSISENLDINKVTTLWTKIREGQYLLGANDDIEHIITGDKENRITYISGNPRLYNYLTAPYENKALGKKTREPRFKTLKELIRDIPNSPLAIEALFTILYYNKEDDSRFKLDLNNTDKQVLSLLYKYIFSPDSKFQRAANKLSQKDTIKFSEQPFNYLTYVEQFFASTVNVPLTLLTSGDNNGVYELNTLVASNRRNTTLNYRDKLARKYSAVLDLGKKVNLFAETKPEIKGFKLDVSEIKLDNKDKIDENAKIKITLSGGVTITVDPRLRVLVYDADNNIIDLKNIFKTFPQVVSFVKEVLNLKAFDFEKVAFPLYKSKNITESDLLGLAGEVLYNYTISSKIITIDKAENASDVIYTEKDMKERAKKYYIGKEELLEKISFQNNSMEILPVFTPIGYVTLYKIAESNDILNGVNRDIIVKGADGNMVSSKTTTQMIANATEQFQRCKNNPNSPVKHFSLLDAFVGPEVARDIKGVGFNKKITDFSIAEHAEFDFIYDFALELVKDETEEDKERILRVLPLIISDKFRVLKAKFDLNAICEHFNKPYKSLTSSEIREIAKIELGNYYENVYNKIKSDWDLVSQAFMSSFFDKEGNQIPFDLINDYGSDLANEDIKLLASIATNLDTLGTELKFIPSLFNSSDDFRRLNRVVSEFKNLLLNKYSSDFNKFLTSENFESLPIDSKQVFLKYLKEFATNNDLDIQDAKTILINAYRAYTINKATEKQLNLVYGLFDTLKGNPDKKITGIINERADAAVHNLLTELIIKNNNKVDENGNIINDIRIVENSYYVLTEDGKFHTNPALVDELYRWEKIDENQLRTFGWTEDQIKTSRGRYKDFFKTKNLLYLTDMLQEGMELNLVNQYGEKLDDPKINKLVDTLNDLGKKAGIGNWVTYGNSIVLAKIKYQGYNEETGEVEDKFLMIKNLDSIVNNNYIKFAVRYYKDNHPEFKFDSIEEFAESPSFSLQFLTKNILPEYLSHIDAARFSKREAERLLKAQIDSINDRLNRRKEIAEALADKAELEGNTSRALYYRGKIKNYEDLADASIKAVNSHYEKLAKFREKVGDSKNRASYSRITVVMNPLLQKFNEFSYLFGLEYTNATVGSYINHPGKNIYNIREYQSNAFLQLVKRNVTMSASKHSFILNTLEGLPSTVKAAIVTNTQDLVSTILGDVAKVYDYDGALFVSGITNYLENKSLKGDSVGVDKKIFIHDYMENIGLGQIIKCAGFSTTNWRIRNSLLWSDLNYKLLTGNQFALLPYLNGGGIDITKSLYGSLMVYENIIYRATKESLPIYDGNSENVLQLDGDVIEVVSIDGFNPTNGRVEFTIQNHTSGTNIQKVSAQLKNVHDIWLFFGGAYSMDSKDSTTYNERSFEQATFAVNYVGTIENGQPKQYLKESIVHYMPSVECTKQGACNINDITLFNNRDNQLALFNLNLYDAGIQLNAEHESDDSVLSMMTLVVNALGARGYTAEEANEVYEALHRLTQLTLSDYINSLTNRGSEKSKASLTSFISKVLFKTLQAQAADVNPDNFADCLINEATEIIKYQTKGRSVTFEDIKSVLPIDDPVVLSNLMSRISSILTKSSIKMKFPGTMDVLVPSNGFLKLYGNKLLGEYSSKDEAYNLPDVLTYPHDIKIGRIYKIVPEEGLVPYEFVDEEGNIKVETPKEYYSIKRYLQNHNASLYEVQSKGRDLAGYNLMFSDTNGKIYNIWDVDSVKKAFINGTQTQFTQSLQLALDALNPNNSAAVEISVDGHKVTVNKNSIKAEPYELVMSLLYQKQFGLKVGDSVNDIVNDKLFFLKRALEKRSPKILDLSAYDVELKTIDGDHKYFILDDNIPSDFVLSDNIQVDDLGLYWYCNYRGEQLFQLNSKEDKVYTNGRALLIKTDDISFYLNNIDHVGINLSSRLLEKSDEDILQFIDALRKSDSKFANSLANRFTREGKNASRGMSKTMQEISIAESFKQLIDTWNKENKSELEKLNRALEKGDNVALNELIDQSEHLTNLRNKSLEIHTSFIKSLDILAARIPAQCMLSFMAMKVVGFDESGLNSAYVSRWLIYLQGSDFDIDKVSLLGFKFRNGQFIKWSPYMDLSSEETLRASEDLPFPTSFGITEENDDGTISYKTISDPEFALEINSFISTNYGNDTIAYINNLATILKKVNKLGGIPVELDDDSKSRIAEIVNKHNLYIKNGKIDQLGALINFVSSKMHSISKNAVNLKQAQSSVDAENGAVKRVKKLAKGLEYSQRLTNVDGGSLSSLYRTRSLTIGGKSNTGIVAASLKVFEAYLQYSYNILNNGTEEQIRSLLINREICKQNIHFLANVHALKDNPNIPAEFKEFLDKHDEEDFYLMFSGFLSLATDNAKDPTLAKINAESKMIGLYLAGFTLGISIDKLIPILTSRAAIKIAELMKEDVFNHHEGLFDVASVIDYVSDNRIDQIATIKSKVKEVIYNLIYVPSVKDKKKLKKLNEFDADYFVTSQLRYSSYDFIDKLNEIISNGSAKNEVITDLRRFRNKILKYLNILKTIRNQEAIVGYEDVEINGNPERVPVTVNVFEEIRKLEAMHQEMLSFSQDAKLNLGLPNKIDEQIQWKRKFEKRISKRLANRGIKKEVKSEIEKRLKELNQRTFPQYTEDMPRYKELMKSVNFTEFMENPEYRREIIDIYDKIKFAINIMDIANNVEHYKGYSETLSALFAVNENMSPTWHLLDYISSTINDDKDDIGRTLDWINTSTIQEFLLERNFEFPISKELPHFVKSGRTIELVTDVNESSQPFIRLGTDEGNATFKYIFENYVIDTLRNQSTVFNTLLNDLTPIKTDKTPDKNIGTKVATDVKLIPSNDYERKMIDIYKQSLKSLSGKTVPEFGGANALDIIFLYNLITNDNKIGESSLTTLFQDYVFSNQSKLISDYFEFRKMSASYLMKLIHSLSLNDLKSYELGIAKKVYFPLPSGKTAPNYVLVEDSGKITYLCEKIKTPGTLTSNSEEEDYIPQDIFIESAAPDITEQQVLETIDLGVDQLGGDFNHYNTYTKFKAKVENNGYRIIGKITQSINYFKTPSSTQLRSLFYELSLIAGVSEEQLKLMEKEGKFDPQLAKEVKETKCD